MGVEQAAGYLGLSSWSVRDLVSEGQLRPVEIPMGGKTLRRLLFDRLALDAWVDGLTPSTA